MTSKSRTLGALSALLTPVLLSAFPLPAEATTVTTTSSTITASTVADTSLPVVAVTTPANASKVTSLPAISGTASDEDGAFRPAVYRVVVTIDGGTVTVDVPVNASGVATPTQFNWDGATGDIQGTVSATGLVAFTATDFEPGSVRERIDIQLAKTNGVITGSGQLNDTDHWPDEPQFYGTVTVTKLPGSGLNRVELGLKRNSDGVYWTGTAWGTAMPVVLSTTRSGTNWTRNSGLPVVATTDATKKLASGLYSVIAKAFDNAGNSRSVTTTFTVEAAATDTTIPVSVVATTPANSAAVAALTSITGAAEDNAGGSGIARIDASLRRKNSSGVYEYWALRSGVWSWSTVVTPIAAKLTAPGALSTGWSIAANAPTGTLLPSGTNLPQGTYYVFASAYDKAGNKKVSSVNAFRVDTTIPASVTVTTPANSGAVAALTSITGVSADNIDGSGIARIDTFLRRKNSSGVLEYWALRNGVWSWSTVATPIAAKLTAPGALSTGWSVANNAPAGTVLPSATNLPQGTYYVFASAYDKAGNKKVSTVNAFKVDTTLPASVAVTTPANGSTATTLTSIGGTSADDASGSGIARVDALLRRKNSSGVYEYWALRSGVWSWSTIVTPIAAKLTAPGALSTGWSIAANAPTGTVLPTGANLPAGVYSTFAHAYDKAGNKKTSIANSFTIAAATNVRNEVTTTSEATVTTPQIQLSPIVLSSAGASATGTITLNFTGALDAATATDAVRYSVTVNGQTADVESIALKNGTTVIVNLLSGSLQVGSEVSVAYNLLDSKKRSITGKTTVIAR